MNRLTTSGLISKYDSVKLKILAKAESHPFSKVAFNQIGTNKKDVLGIDKYRDV